MIMETTKKKILLYQERDFSAKFDDTFAFIKQNYKVLLKYVTYLLLPVSLVQAIAFDGYMDGTMNLSEAGGQGWEAVQGMVLSMSGLYLTMVIGSVLLYALVYAVMAIYEDSDNGIGALTGEELKPTLLRNVRRGLLMVLFMGLLMLVAVAVGAVLAALVSLWLLLPAIVGLFIVMVPLILFMPIYLFEPEISLVGALRKSMRLGFANWWSTLAITLVLSIIMAFVQGVFATPYYIAIIVKAVLGVQNGFEGLADSAAYSFMTYLLGVLQSFATYVLTTIVAVGIALQYGHAAEKEDHVTMESSIEHFDQL